MGKKNKHPSFSRDFFFWWKEISCKLKRRTSAEDETQLVGGVNFFLSQLFLFSPPSLSSSCKHAAVTTADLVGLASRHRSVFVSVLFYKYEIRAMADPMCSCVVNWDLASLTPVYARALHHHHPSLMLGNWLRCSHGQLTSAEIF